MASNGAWWGAPWHALFSRSDAADEPAHSEASNPPAKAAEVVHTSAHASDAASRAGDATSLLRSVQASQRDVAASTSTLDEPEEDEADVGGASRFLVFSNAGKLVYASGDTSEGVYGDVGVLQALLAVFADEHRGALETICLEDAHARQTRISVLTHRPLHVVCVSTRDEPRALVQAQLGRVYAAVVSLVSETRVQRLFQQRPNFDLRGLLAPMQTYLDDVVAEMETSLALLFDALPVHPLDAALRAEIARAVTPIPEPGDAARPRDVLYALVVRCGHLVCLARPKRHTPHVEDVALLYTLVRHGGACQSGEDTWAPMCLPHAAPHGFVFVYASRLHPGADGAALVLVTGDRDGYERARAWRARLADACAHGCLRTLHARPLHETVDALGVPGLRHYVLVSRRHTQCTATPAPYASGASNRRLYALYAHALAALQGDARPAEVRAALDAARDARVPQRAACRLQHYRTAHEAVLGWRTASFTLLLTVRPPWLSKTAIAAAASKVAAHVRRNDRDLFAAAYTF